MLPLLETRILDALVRDGDDAGSWMIRQAKRCLNIDRNLSLGILMLLSTYGLFSAEIYQNEAPLDTDKKGADSWHIGFRYPPFDDLSIYPTSVEGVIDVHILKKPFLSISIFAKPRNWQTMLQWLWEHGDKRQIARSIPQLDPQRLRALANEKDGEAESGQMGTGGFTESKVQDNDLSIRVAREAFARGDMARGMYEILVAFHIFEPSLNQDNLPPVHAGVGNQEWYISFRVSPFRSLRLQPSQNEGMIDLYAFEKHVKSLQFTSSPQSWQAILESLWDCGNRRHIEKAEYEASHPQSISETKRKSERPRGQKNLLHYVLRTASFKAQEGPRTIREEVVHKQKAANGAVDTVDRKALRRRVLHPASPNKKIGHSKLATSMTADEVDANVKAGLDCA